MATIDVGKGSKVGVWGGVGRLDVHIYLCSFVWVGECEIRLHGNEAPN